MMGEAAQAETSFGPIAAVLPAISVVISAKNRAALLFDCFLGLSGQSLPFDQFEIVLVDNCSTDDLGAVASRARRELGLTVRLYRTEVDHGPAPARNLGVNRALGAIIAFTDSDCRPSPAWLEAGLAAFADPDIALVTGPVLPKPGEAETITSKMSFVTPTEHPTFPTANAFYRRGVFLSHGGFDPRLSFHDPLDRATECADTDLAWRIIKSGGKRRFLPDAVMYHTVEDQSLLLFILEGTRLFVLPELVRRHPELRQALLRGRVFFYPRSWLIYVGGAALVGASIWEPWLLVLPVLALLARGVQRTGGIRPGPLLTFCARAAVYVPRMMIMTLALAYGSARFRCLVL